MAEGDQADGDQADGDQGVGWVGLREAILGLRADLTAALWDGENSRIRFKVEPIELTLEVGVTGQGKTEAGVRWHIITLGGELSRQKVATQTLKLKLTPVVFADNGEPAPEHEQFISDNGL
jgi:hypothetical protein